jgi:magnesium transporter
MLRVLRRGASAFDTPASDGGEWMLPDGAVWIDLIDPSLDEERAVERVLKLQLPTREEMTAIEPSSRLYQEAGAIFITAFVLINSETDKPDTEPVTFVLTADQLVTIRYAEAKAFRLFATKAEKQPNLCVTSADTFLHLLDAIVDRTADVLERISDDVDGISRAIFAEPRSKSFAGCLTQLGRVQTTNAELRKSLSSLSRAGSFGLLAPAVEQNREHRDHLRTVVRDADSLGQQSDALANNVGFLLNAALGFINLEQSDRSKVFSIVAVLFLPPTLVASTYGMNFELMPELGWRFGYPSALGLMATSVAVSLLWFKRKGWL